MRKLNTILSVLLLFICLLHGLMGSFMLLGILSLIHISEPTRP